MRVIAPFSNDKISDDAAARSAIFSLLRRRAMAPPNILPFVVAGRAVEPATESPTDDLGPQFNFTVWFLMSLAGGFLAMRLYCQISRHRDLWWDDYVLVAATLSLLGSTIMATVSTTFGYGKHSQFIATANIGDLVLANTVTGFFSVLASMWSKTSFALTLIRISSVRVQKFVWCLIVALNMVLSVLAVLLWAQCIPLRKLWDFSVEGHCLPRQVVSDYNIFSAVFSTTMDLTLAALPWSILRNLKRNKEKTAIMLAMSMGVFAAFASIVKITKVYTTESIDLFDGVDFVLWGITEAAVTIMAASVPVLRGTIGKAPRHRPVLDPTSQPQSTTSSEDRNEDDEVDKADEMDEKNANTKKSREDEHSEERS